MRDRLIDLIAKSNLVLVDGGIHPDTHLCQEALADHLLAEGVISLPVKVGDKLYGFRDRVIEYTVTEFLIKSRDIIIYGVDNCHECAICTVNDIGKDEIFLTREEAEKALERIEQ